jgi:hypothetical protein
MLLRSGGQDYCRNVRASPKKTKINQNTNGKSARIAAAVRIDSADAAGRSNGPPLRPVPKPGFYSADIRVPAEQSHLSFADACEKLIVDTTGKRPTFKLAPDTKS